MPTDEDKVLVALASAGATGLSLNEIRRRVFHGHRTKDALDGLLGELVTHEIIETWKAPSNGHGGPRLQRFRVRTQTREEPVEVSEPDDVPPSDDGARPPGDGWVAWKDLVYIAEAGVPRGYALRQGQKEMERQRVANKTVKPGRVVLTDEQRGIRLIAREGLRLGVRAGFIERQGDWGRLLRDPVMTQRPWMEAVYTILGRAHPTLTGEFIPKPPRTLVSVKEAELGRKLLPDEFLRRKPGKGGSWDPEDIEIRVRLPHTSSVTEMEEFIAGYHARVAEAPRIQEPRSFEVNLPKNRRP